jgi:GntR family transcriptional repressor for pyruvate dehydrogenase complex
VDLSGLAPIRPAYRQIADDLRARVVDGRLTPGSRLPNELELAAQVGVSRATVREALRTLAAEGLIHTSRGVSGGSVVAAPTTAGFAEAVSGPLSLVSRVEDVTLDEFMESRAVLEVPAARLAARRHDENSVQELRSSVPSVPLGAAEQYRHNRDFHFTLVEVCGNRLLVTAAQPIFLVLQTRLDRSRLGPAFHRTVTTHHSDIADAVEAGDEGAAADAMAAHLEWLAPRYRRAWSSQ